MATEPPVSYGMIHNTCWVCKYPPPLSLYAPDPSAAPKAHTAHFYDLQCHDFGQDDDGYTVTHLICANCITHAWVASQQDFVPCPMFWCKSNAGFPAFKPIQDLTINQTLIDRVANKMLELEAKKHLIDVDSDDFASILLCLFQFTLDATANPLASGSLSDPVGTDADFTFVLAPLNQIFLTIVHSLAGARKHVFSPIELMRRLGEALDDALREYIRRHDTRLGPWGQHAINNGQKSWFLKQSKFKNSLYVEMGMRWEVIIHQTVNVLCLRHEERLGGMADEANS
ncbi:hypothetical protein N0V90_005222 [Kalmusia sp. IMI 367209]|nr:hypothetical protein N0V90_005222 [Kalmusia sp. IMI 367209]